MSDPVRDLKQELLAAASRQQGDAPAHPAGYRILLAAAALAVAAVVALLVTSPWSSSGFLERAEAALTPPAGTILHLKWELTATSTDPACTVRHGPSEMWIDQTPPHRFRVLMDTLPSVDAASTDSRGLVCSNWTGDEIGGAFDTGERLRFEPPSTLRPLSGQFYHSLDPVQALRDSLSAGAAHDEGTTQVDGRMLRRIRVDPGSDCPVPACPREPFYWFVDPETFHPVRGEGAGGLSQPNEGFVPLHVVVRYLEYAYLPRTPANLALADIRAQHPDAAVAG